MYSYSFSHIPFSCILGSVKRMEVKAELSYIKYMYQALVLLYLVLLYVSAVG